MRGSCAHRGFSLLEAAVALALLAALCAIVLPAFTGRSERATREHAVHGIERGVGAAQALARQRGSVVRVTAAGAPARLEGAVVGAEDGTPGPDAGPNAPGTEWLAELPAGAAVIRGSAGDPPGAGPKPDGAEPAPVVIGWAMPDGSFTPAGGLGLLVAGASADLTISAWTGTVTPGAWEPVGDGVGP